MGGTEHQSVMEVIAAMSAYTTPPQTIKDFEEDTCLLSEF